MHKILNRIDTFEGLLLKIIPRLPRTYHSTVSCVLIRFEHINDDDDDDDDDESWSNNSREAKLSFSSHIKTVWFSFQWISASSSGPSNDATPPCLRSSMCSWRCGSDRSGWSDDSCCTTSHLCTSLHTSLTACRCPGLECWTSVQDAAMSVNHLYTADRTLTRFTKLHLLLYHSKVSDSA